MDFKLIKDPNNEIDFYNNYTYDISDNGVKKYFDLLSFKYITYTNTAHFVIGYGYRDIDYYTMNYSNGSTYLFDNMFFFIVANGWGGKSYINSKNSDIAISYSIYPKN
jgi:hypothetical protein